MKAETIYGNPGTGKTYTIAERIKSLHDQGYTEDDIQVLSHTKVAAKEIANRADGAKASTIHSLAYRYAGVIKEQVASTSEIRKFSEQIGIPIKGVGNDGTTSVEAGDEYINLINLSSNLMINPLSYYQKELPTAGYYDEFKYFYQSYLNWKKTYGMIDFNDMISECLAESVVDVDFKVLFIDEAQDLSPLQWKFIDSMIRSNKLERVVITGDPDQSLFIWGGADPQGMEKFTKKYDSSITELSQSYRVPIAAYGISKDIINKVHNRYEKDYKPTEASGKNIFYSNPMGIDWNDYKNRDVLVLYRTHSLRREVEQELIDWCLPYKVLSGKHGLFDNKWARALRVIHAVKNGSLISQPQINFLHGLSSIKGQLLLKNKDFKGYVETNISGTLLIPVEQVAYYQNIQDSINVEPNIKLSTIHGAKGMEADVVMVLDGMVNRVAEGLHSQPDLEHRVWFVAVTRTKNELIWINSINGEGYRL